MKIPVFRPLIEAEEFQAATDVLELGWLGMGAYVGQFEKALEDLIGASDRHVVATSTGHAALHLAMIVAGIGPGDEVITPSFNNIADFQAILAVGAEPVFCDIDPVTLSIDLEKASQLVGPKTKAAIVMDYDCCLADHAGVEKFAQTSGLRIIHDAAHSLGSLYRGRPIGSFSDICMFSFDPVKTITCIDGGALVVRSQEEKQMLHELRLIGMGQPAEVMYQNRRAWTYDVKRLGFRYHMANLHAAIGLSQIHKMSEISASRQAACRQYSQRLAAVKQVVIPHSDFQDITPFLYYIQVPPHSRQPLRDYLEQSGIDTGIHWQPGHTFSLLKNCRRGDLSVTERVAEGILSLPLHSKMEESTVSFICSKIEEFFESVFSDARL